MLGRAVVGNLRGFILACNRFDSIDKIGIPELQKCMLDMASDYFWPLMEEVAPKLGIYEALIEPARDVMEAIVEHSTKPVKAGQRANAQDRILIHRQIVSQYLKIFEILEYLGFVAKREASRALKSGGRGPIYAINLCSLLEATPSRRLTFEMIEEWLKASGEPAEVYVASTTFQHIRLPKLPEENGLAILDRELRVLGRSPAYPYGLTEAIIQRLSAAGMSTVGQLAHATDAELDQIDYIGQAKIKTIRDVVFQAIWM
jgi:ribonucleotide reductase alpha subunit